MLAIQPAYTPQLSLRMFYGTDSGYSINPQQCSGLGLKLSTPTESKSAVSVKRKIISTSTLHSKQSLDRPSKRAKLIVGKNQEFRPKGDVQHRQKTEEERTGQSPSNHNTPFLLENGRKRVHAVSHAEAGTGNQVEGEGSDEKAAGDNTHDNGLHLPAPDSPDESDNLDEPDKTDDENDANDEYDSDDSDISDDPDNLDDSNNLDGSDAPDDADDQDDPDDSDEPDDTGNGKLNPKKKCWWDLPGELRNMIYRLIVTCQNPVQKPDWKLSTEWRGHDIRTQEQEQVAQQKAAYEREISELLQRPRTEVRQRITAGTKRLIAAVKAKIIALDSQWQMEDLQQRLQTRQTTESLEDATNDFEYDLQDEVVNFGQNYQQVDIGLFLVSRKCSQEAIGIFYDVNLIRIVPRLVVINPERNELGYAKFLIDRDSKRLLQTAVNMRVRVQYVTMELVVNELRSRNDLRTVQIQFCDDMIRGSLDTLIEPFKIFREIDMSGGTASCIKRFTIESVEIELDPYCDLSREVSTGYNQDMRDYWDNIRDVVEGRRKDCVTNGLFLGINFPRRPRVGPWL